jgi:hypothetical protein
LSAFSENFEAWIPKIFCAVAVLHTVCLANVFSFASLETLRSWESVGEYSLIFTVSFCLLTIWASFRSKSSSATNVYWIVTFIVLVPCIIATFALINTGAVLVHSNVEIEPSKSEALYFSVVTFTTLGYGDYSPSEALRPISAFQALLGFTFIPLFIAELIKFSQRNEPSKVETDLRSSLKTLLKSSIVQQEKVETIAFELNGLADRLIQDKRPENPSPEPEKSA